MQTITKETRTTSEEVKCELQGQGRTVWDCVNIVCPKVDFMGDDQRRK